MDCIAVNWPDQLPENLPFVLPKWDDGSAWAKCGEVDFVDYFPRPPPILPTNGVATK